MLREEDIVRKVRQRRDDIVRHGSSSAMPAFPESELSDDALKQIVDYLKTLNQTHVK